MITLLGTRLFGRCDICSTVFVDDQDIAKRLDGKFVITKKGLKLYPVCKLIEVVNAEAIVLNIYYLVGEYLSKTKNFGELFLEIANTSFGVYIFYVQIYVTMFFNLLKPVTKKVIDNYLAEHCCSSQNVSKTKKKIKNDLFSGYLKTASKLLNYLNIVLSGDAFEHIFFRYRPFVDYNSETFKLLNAK